MPKQINEFVSAWDALASSSAAEKGWLGITVASCGACELLAARRFPGKEEALLVGFSKARLGTSERLPEGNGFEVVSANPRGDGKTWIALTKKESGNLELFIEMVDDVAGTLMDASDKEENVVLHTMLRRIRMWQQFMSRGAGPLSPEAELGLAGEIHFITTFFEFGVSPETLINSWVGPDDSPQDFVFANGAIEVKATLSSSGFPVKIGSLEQLDDAIHSPLFLAAVKFTVTDNGLTLPEMIAKLERTVEDEHGVSQLLRERLMTAGYSETHANQYNRKFEPKENIVLSVTENFPRLTTGSVPAGITRSIYEINLDHARRFCIDLNVVLNKLGVIG